MSTAAPLLCALALVPPVMGAAVPPAAPPPAVGGRDEAALAIPLEQQPWTGDLDGMLARRRIRVLVTYSRVSFWVEKGRVRGATYEAFRAFEGALNERHKTGRKSLRHHVVFVPVRRDELIPALLAGKGDIAAAALAVTPERGKIVDFTRPTLRGVAQIAVTGPASAPLQGVDGLSGREVLVRRSSAYWERLEALNERLAAAGKPPAVLRAAPEELEDEDLLEMVNAGLADVTVVYDLKARLWARVYPALVLHPDAAVDTGGALAWMIRKGSPLLEKELDLFIEKNGPGTAFEKDLLQRYTGSTRFLKPATGGAERKKFDRLVATFRRYAEQYDVDYLLAMAQGYQESQLDQDARSAVGAIGVMQLMPATGAELRVGDVTQVEPNVHGGIKYLRHLVDDGFAEPGIGDLDRVLFGFAAYNAGPGRVADLRREAAKRGLDPNVWFANVEVVAADRIGPETVTYVANIFKYYIAYRFMVEQDAARARAASELRGAP